MKKPKITKSVEGNTTTYFYNGIKKYKYYYNNSDGYEEWREYDKQGNEIHCKDSDGDEWWSDDNPDNPKNKPEVIKEEDVKPFEFEKKI